MANSNRRSKPQVYRVKPVINSYSQAGTAPFETRIEQAPVIVVGTADNKGFSILVDSLSGQRCEVICVEHHGQLYDHVLEQATLVFVLVSGFSVQLLNAETEALIRRAPHISLDSEFRTLPEWDSLAALGVIVMFDMEYQKPCPAMTCTRS
ncbi:hypothetical protein [Pseudomonas fragi]|uniref:hypothetical protein n=1 Tax=Pseudomonas fragi TaxID=296 RepID=UPI001CB6DE6D|nr:hypothetical protein [Pseudomonas fragi]